MTKRSIVIGLLVAALWPAGWLYAAKKPGHLSPGNPFHSSQVNNRPSAPLQLGGPSHDAPYQAYGQVSLGRPSSGRNLTPANAFSEIRVDPAYLPPPPQYSTASPLSLSPASQRRLVSARVPSEKRLLSDGEGVVHEGKVERQVSIEPVDIAKHTYFKDKKQKSVFEAVDDVQEALARPEFEAAPTRRVLQVDPLTGVQKAVDVPGEHSQMAGQLRGAEGDLHAILRTNRDQGFTPLLAAVGTSIGKAFEHPRGGDLPPDAQDRAQVIAARQAVVKRFGEGSQLEVQAVANTIMIDVIKKGVPTDAGLCKRTFLSLKRMHKRLKLSKPEGLVGAVAILSLIFRAQGTIFFGVSTTVAVLAVALVAAPVLIAREKDRKRVVDLMLQDGLFEHDITKPELVKATAAVAERVSGESKISDKKFGEVINVLRGLLGRKVSGVQEGAQEARQVAQQVKQARGVTLDKTAVERVDEYLTSNSDKWANQSPLRVAAPY